MRSYEMLFVLIVVALILMGIVFSATEAADLKCVTIKFKNDSELKLKTQWFVNGCDTTKNIVWVKHQYMDSAMVPYDLAEKDRQGLKYEWTWQERGMIRWQEIQTTVTCRILLFPPEVRKEPKPYTYEKWPAEDSKEWKKVWVDSTYVVQSITVTDTIPGEALLWYEETR